MKRRLISPRTSWPCTIASALQLEFRRSYGATRLPLTPRLGSSIWRQARQAARSSTVCRCLGGNKLNHARMARVRTWQGLARVTLKLKSRLRSYSTAGSTKSVLITLKPILVHLSRPRHRAVITRRWSGIPRKRSDAQPPFRQIMSFYHAATARRAISSGRSRIRRAPFLLR